MVRGKMGRVSGRLRAKARDAPWRLAHWRVPRRSASGMIRRCRRNALRFSALRPTA